MTENESDLEMAVVSAVAQLMNFAEEMFPGEPAKSVSLLETAYVMSVVNHYGTGEDVEECLIDSLLQAYDIASEVEEHV